MKTRTEEKALLNFFASWPIRWKLLLLLLIVFLPAFGIIVVNGLNQRKEEIARLQDDALLLVQSLAARQEGIAVAARTLLGTLTRLPEVRRLDGKACTALFHDLHRRYPFYSTILAASSDGRVFAASMPFRPGSIDIPEGEHVADGMRIIDPPGREYTGRKGSSVPLLSLAMPVFDEKGKPVATVVVGFDLLGYVRLVSGANPPEGYAVTIADHKGTRLLRLPESSIAVPGGAITGEALRHVSGSQDKGFYEAKGQDDIERVYAFKQVRLREGSPPYLYMIAGMAKGTILRKASLKMTRNLSILGMAALVALSLSWVSGYFILVRPMNRLVASARRFGRGQMRTRTGVPHTADEIGRLASAFDDMALELERQNTEREDAEQALSRAYAQLETRVQDRTAELSAANAALTAEVAERKRAEQSRRESESRYRYLVQHANSIIMRIDMEGRVTFVNEFARRFFGYAGEEMLGRNVVGTIVPEYESTGRNLRDLVEDIRRDPDRHTSGVNENMRRNGDRVWIAWTNKQVPGDEGRAAEILCVGNDITDRKQAEESLREREKELEHKSASLEEANTALKVLLRNSDEDRKALESMVLANLKELVFPYIERLGRGQLSDVQKTYLGMIESNLNDIASPFLRKMTSVYDRFTPAEVQIANLIKSGKTSKEIAEMLNVCTGTVDAHRNNIRSKLGLSNKNINLQTYLRSLST